MKQEKLYKPSYKEFKELFNTNYTGLCFFAEKYVNDRLLSEDIVQEVFVKIWEQKLSFKEKNAVKSFLYTAIKHKCLDHLKNRNHTVTNSFPLEKIEDMQTETYFLKEIVVAETSILIEKSLKALPTKCAEIIRLSIQEYSNEQIADQLSISINTVKAQKRIGYQKLRPLLKDYYYSILSGILLFS